MDGESPRYGDSMVTREDFHARAQSPISPGQLQASASPEKDESARGWFPSDACLYVYVYLYISVYLIYYVYIYVYIYIYIYVYDYVCAYRKRFCIKYMYIHVYVY